MSQPTSRPRGESGIASGDGPRPSPLSSQDTVLFPPAGDPPLAVPEGSTPVEHPLPPDLVGHPRYCVLELLGTGGMGTVYKARHRVMDRLVALKTVNPELLDRPEMGERFRREVRAAARLSHPNVVHAYDADQAGATHFLVMEYVPGVNLAQVLRERGPLPVDRACDYARQAALGLQHACEHGMVHRDVKPHNLLLTPRDGSRSATSAWPASPARRPRTAAGPTRPGTPA